MSRGDRPQPSQQRTAAERERDRLERERRRAQREGEVYAPVPNEPSAAEPSRVPSPPTQVPLPEAPLPEAPRPAAAPPPLPDPEPAPPPPPLSPMASRRETRAKGPRGPRRITGARIAALLALLLAAGLVWFLVSLFQPFAGPGSGRVIVTIPKGSSASKIGSILAREGVVSSGFFFDLRALVEGKRSSLHSGRFALKREMSYAAALVALSKPPPQAIVVKLTIPEGYTRRQIADLASEDELGGSYLSASKRSSLLNPRHYGAPKGTPNLEGFLFPATYELRAGTPAKRLVDEQLLAFRRRFGREDIRRAHELGVTPYELLTVASMIEREAGTGADRPKVAAVIYNRLREGIPLGIDATTVYAIELQRNIPVYAGELTASQLQIDSPYNTRTHKGLPPTPISNPGEASIEAAAHPSHAGYLYYVAGADGCGEQVFSKTEAEFQKNVAAYREALKKNGGHLPRCKKK